MTSDLEAAIDADASIGIVIDTTADSDDNVDVDSPTATDTEAGAGPNGVVNAPPTSSRRPNWGRVAAVLSLLYVCWYIIGLVLLEASPSTYNSMNKTYGGFAGRVALSLVVLALLFHLLDGLRVTCEDLVPKLVRRDVALRAVTRFLLFATWIPATVVLLWPAIRGWFAR